MRRSTLDGSDSNSPSHNHYLKGINYLLNEDQDKAVDVFLEMVEIDSETVETHLALGSLFRRRGEVDRATRIHQNITARPNLSRVQRYQALYELALDYMRAGFLDRAEEFFLQLEYIPETRQESLEKLLEIYQLQREWHKAIAIIARLASWRDNSQYQIIKAHYYCELAELEFGEGNREKAFRYTKKGIALYKDCVRAYILQAKYFVNDKKYKSALKIIHFLNNNYIHYFIETFTLLSECYAKLGKTLELGLYVEDLLVQNPALLRDEIIYKYLHIVKSAKLEKLLKDYLIANPNLFTIKAYIETQLAKASTDSNSWAYLSKVVGLALIDKAKYQCQQCGFASLALFWFCPSCKSWNMVKPLYITT